MDRNLEIALVSAALAAVTDPLSTGRDIPQSMREFFRTCVDAIARFFIKLDSTTEQ
jgi:hypothetical protein